MQRRLCTLGDQAVRRRIQDQHGTWPRWRAGWMALQFDHHSDPVEQLLACEAGNEFAKVGAPESLDRGGRGQKATDARSHDSLNGGGRQRPQRAQQQPEDAGAGRIGGIGVAQQQRAHPIRMVRGQALGHQPAVRTADHVSRRYALPVQDADDAGPQRRRPRNDRRIRERDHPIVGGEGQQVLEGSLGVPHGSR